MKRYQQQHEQENAWRRGPTIHQFPPTCTVRALHTAQDTMNQPQSAQTNSGIAHRPQRKTPSHPETNLHQSKARQTMAEHQNQSINQSINQIYLKSILKIHTVNCIETTNKRFVFLIKIDYTKNSFTILINITN